MLEKIDYSNSFSIQIEDDCFRLVDLKVNKREIKILGYVKKPLAEGIVSKGVVKHHKELEEAITRALHDCYPSPIKKKKVICSIPEYKSFVKVIEMPLVEEKDAGESIKWETEDNIPLPLDKVYFDWKIIQKNEKENKMNVIVAAAPKNVIDSRIEVLRGCGLIPIGFQPDSFALAKCFEKEEPVPDKERYSAIIYLGEEKTIILIREGNSVIFSSGIMFSVIDLREKIAERLALSRGKNYKLEQMNREKNNAFQNLEKYGFDLKFKKGQEHFEAAQGIINELIREIKNAFNYFEERGQKISHVYLTGSGANLKGMDTILSKEINHNNEENKELEGYQVEHSKITMPKNSFSQYAIALGNALG